MRAMTIMQTTVMAVAVMGVLHGCTSGFSVRFRNDLGGPVTISQFISGDGVVWLRKDQQVLNRSGIQTWLIFEGCEGAGYQRFRLTAESAGLKAGIWEGSESDLTKIVREDTVLAIQRGTSEGLSFATESKR